MGFFTDSPYERMMSQKPYSVGRADIPQTVLPPGHRCGGCPYGVASACVGICMKELLGKGKAENKGETVRKKADCNT